MLDITRDYVFTGLSLYEDEGSIAIAPDGPKRVEMNCLIPLAEPSAPVALDGVEDKLFRAGWTRLPPQQTHQLRYRLDAPITTDTVTIRIYLSDGSIEELRSYLDCRVVVSLKPPEDRRT